MQVELIYEQSCPNIEAARTQLLTAFRDAGLSPRWREWEVSQADTPVYACGLGSPTILVDGEDVSADAVPGHGDCCRVYPAPAGGYSGVPVLADIVEALKGASRQPGSEPHESGKRWRMNSAMLPAIGVAFLPKLVCPACWPAYAGLLSSMGLGFIDYTPYLLPLTLLFLLIALEALLYRAPQRHGYRPFVLGLAAGALLLIGKFQFNSDPAMYLGLGLLVAASLWNSWPKRRQDADPCPACNTTDPESAGQ